ncbi:transmembrane protease serine 2-like [Gigantopelta aegis]|uniref:transmembrane protease serine 2-like n=1 Tax=Gigantopelta aegis TaxID=1735272 RepID=UPI001B88E28C|nr:transmembrane protease serine 2-like [Gigantopelta aegis]
MFYRQHTQLHICPSFHQHHLQRRINGWICPTLRTTEVESPLMVTIDSSTVQRIDSSELTVDGIESTIPVVERTHSVFITDTSTPQMVSTSYSEFSSTADIVDISASSVETGIMTTVIPVITTPATILPACKATEYQCDGGECIPKRQVCDQVTNCRDQSDEHFCANCTGFQCSSGLCLWDSFRQHCDGIFHCADLSDEKQCPLRPGNRLCKNGVQISRLRWCDGVDNCFDNSDEASCPCVNGLYACPDGSCILREWMCDGHADCQNGTDEEGCSSCSKDQFVCSDYTCLNQSQVCDGNYSCSGRDDEINCFHLPENSTEPLRIRVENESFPVCADHWTSTHSHFVCQENGQTLRSSSLISSPNISTEVLALRDNQTFNPGIQPVLRNFDRRLSCLSERLVSVSCKQQECGEKKASVLTPFIAGGSVALEGKWPWVAAISYLGKYQCTGAVIGRRWIITAGHCVSRPDSYNYSSTPYYFEIVLGTTDRTHNVSENVQRLRAVRAITHPDLRLTDAGIVDWDVALLETAADIRYTDYVQPVCLPDSGEILSTSLLCYVAGWGWLSTQQYVTTEKLRDAKMQLWTAGRCAGNTVVGETVVNTNSTLCAGYLMGRPTACQGDSGGPLMCQKFPRGRWHLAGVVSSGSNECGQLSPGMRANRFARVASVVDWIHRVIAE